MDQDQPQAAALRTSRELLAIALAWQLQARKQGGLKPSVRHRLQAIAKADERQHPQTELDPSVKFRPGTVLLRDWRGQRHAVTVLEEGFSYQGKSCQSLSHIAREITGTRWNGPAFSASARTTAQTEVASEH